MTLQEKIAELRLQYPTLKVGSEEDGYTDLSDTEYEATITQWAQSALDAQIPVPEPTITEKLASVGLTVADLKTALGL